MYVKPVSPPSLRSPVNELSCRSLSARGRAGARCHAPAPNRRLRRFEAAGRRGGLSVGETGPLTHSLFKLVRFLRGSTAPVRLFSWSSSENMFVSALNDDGMVPERSLSERSLRARPASARSAMVDRESQTLRRSHHEHARAAAHLAGKRARVPAAGHEERVAGTAARVVAAVRIIGHERVMHAGGMARLDETAQHNTREERSSRAPSPRNRHGARARVRHEPNRGWPTEMGKTRVGLITGQAQDRITVMRSPPAHRLRAGSPGTLACERRPLL